MMINELSIIEIHILFHSIEQTVTLTNKERDCVFVVKLISHQLIVEESFVRSDVFQLFFRSVRKYSDHQLYFLSRIGMCYSISSIDMCKKDQSMNDL